MNLHNSHYIDSIVNTLNDMHLIDKHSEYKLVVRSTPIEEGEFLDVGNKIVKLKNLLCSLFSGDRMASFKLVNDFNLSSIENLNYFPENGVFDSNIFGRADLVRCNGSWKIHEINLGCNVLGSVIIPSMPRLAGFELKYDVFKEWAVRFSKFWKDTDTVAFVVDEDHIDSVKIQIITYFQELNKYTSAKFILLSPLDLKIENSCLYSMSGTKVDVVFRYFTDMHAIRKPREYEIILKAITKNLVKAPMGFECSLLSNKGCLALLWEMLRNNQLSIESTDLVRDLIPETLFLVSSIKDEVVFNKDSYVIKPLNMFRSIGVYAGLDFNQNDWSDLIGNIISSGQSYIAQKVAKPEIMEISTAGPSGVRSADEQVSWGIFIFDDEPIGAMIKTKPTNESLIIRPEDEFTGFGPSIIK